MRPRSLDADRRSLDQDWAGCLNSPDRHSFRPDGSRGRAAPRRLGRPIHRARRHSDVRTADRIGGQTIWPGRLADRPVRRPLQLRRPSTGSIWLPHVGVYVGTIDLDVVIAVDVHADVSPAPAGPCPAPTASRQPPRPRRKPPRSRALRRTRNRAAAANRLAGRCRLLVSKRIAKLLCPVEVAVH
jgi:hypothetical protein